MKCCGTCARYNGPPKEAQAIGVFCALGCKVGYEWGLECDSWKSKAPKPRPKPFRRWSFDPDTGALAYDDGESCRLVLGDEYQKVVELLNRARAVLPKARAK